MTTDEQEALAAFRERGYEARQSGKALAENPIPQGEFGHATWTAGWMAADDEAE